MWCLFVEEGEGEGVVWVVWVEFEGEEGLVFVVEGGVEGGLEFRHRGVVWRFEVRERGVRGEGKRKSIRRRERDITLFILW